MNTPAFNTHSDLFRSYWLQSLVRPDQVLLPPPLPTLPGILSPKGDGVPSLEDETEGKGLALVITLKDPNEQQERLPKNEKVRS